MNLINGVNNKWRQSKNTAVEIAAESCHCEIWGLPQYSDVMSLALTDSYLSAMGIIIESETEGLYWPEAAFT